MIFYHDNSIIIEIPFKTIDGNNIYYINKVIKDLVNSKEEIILDMSKCKLITGTGLRYLVKNAQYIGVYDKEDQYNFKKKKILLINVKDILKDILEVTGHYSYFKYL